MRLLKVAVEGAELFADDTFSMGFYATDRVSGGAGAVRNHVYRLSSLGVGHVYAQAMPRKTLGLAFSSA